MLKELHGLSPGILGPLSRDVVLHGFTVPELDASSSLSFLAAARWGVLWLAYAFKGLLSIALMHTSLGIEVAPLKPGPVLSG